MNYIYSDYVARFDLSTIAGARDLLQSALNDWRNEEINDQQFDNLNSRAISALNEAYLPTPAFWPTTTDLVDCNALSVAKLAIERWANCLPEDDEHRASIQFYGTNIAHAVVNYLGIAAEARARGAKDLHQVKRHDGKTFTIPMRKDIDNIPHGTRILALREHDLANGGQTLGHLFVAIVDRSNDIYDGPVIDIILGDNDDGYGIAYDLSEVVAWAPIFEEDAPKA